MLYARIAVFVLILSTTQSVLAQGSPSADTQPTRARPEKGKKAATSSPKGEQTPVDAKKARQFRAAADVLASSKKGNALRAAQTTLMKGYPDSRQFLIEATTGKPGRLRAFSLKLLGEIGNVEQDLAIVAVGLQDRLPSVRLSAVMAIQKLGKEGLPFLEKILESEPKPNIRKMAAKTLQRWGDPAAIPHLVRLLEKEADGGVRTFVVGALQKLSGQKLGDDAQAWRSYLENQIMAEQKARLIKGLESEKKRKAKVTNRAEK